MNEPQTKAAMWIGLIFIGIGALATALILGKPAGLSAPSWVALTGASIFFFAGASFLSLSMQNIFLRNICNFCLVLAFGILGWFLLSGS